MNFCLDLLLLFFPFFFIFLKGNSNSFYSGRHERDRQLRSSFLNSLVYRITCFIKLLTAKLIGRVRDIIFMSGACVTLWHNVVGTWPAGRAAVLWQGPGAWQTHEGRAINHIHYMGSSQPHRHILHTAPRGRTRVIRVQDFVLMQKLCRRQGRNVDRRSAVTS